MISVLKYCFLLVIAFTTFVSSAQSIKQGANCFSMLVGKNATEDGSVFLCHNEDDWGELYVDWHKVTAVQHGPNDKIQLENGGIVDQVQESNAYLWLQMPAMQFSDSYLNEHGLAIASNQCRSREDRTDLSDGGIGYWLRRLMIERASSAREAVKLGGALVEKFGYHYSGRTYIIADKNEAWMMAVVKGRHWVAQRIPDDHIAIIPNYYTIQEIDLRDTSNFLGAKDIITYATDRGWFDPNKGERFDFRKAYANIETYYGIWNIPRHLDAINHFSEKPMDYNYDLPLSFKPKVKINLASLFDVMDAHGEGTQFEVPATFENGDPHKTVIKRVCSEGNQYGMVAQLRRGMPGHIAHVLWIAPKRPCIQAFIPWYIGISNIPGDFTRGNPDTQLKSHFSDTELKGKTSDKAYWAYKQLADQVDRNYGELMPDLHAQKSQFQQNLLEKQHMFEELYLEILKSDPLQAQEVLNTYVKSLAEKSLAMTRENTEN